MTLFRDLPGIADVERRYLTFDKFTKEELVQLQRDIDSLSLTMFGITEIDTAWDTLPDRTGIPDRATWERQFEFLEFKYDDEPEFWDAYGIDVRDENGRRLECVDMFGRQMVCALKELHPRACIKFRPPLRRSRSQMTTEASAWSDALARPRPH